MNMRTFMVVVGAVGSLIAGAACEVTTTGNTGGSGGSGGDPTTTSSTTTSSTTAGVGGAGGAGGGEPAKCSCGEYITDPTACPGGFDDTDSEGIYDDLFNCYCGVNGMDGACTMECGTTSCADPPKDPDMACAACATTANTGDCSMQFNECSNDI